MFVSAPLADSPDLVVSRDRRTVEGTGVILSEGTAHSQPLAWRLRIEEKSGVQLKSEWIRIFDRRDHELKDYVTARDLLPHKHKICLSACEGDAEKLDKLSAAITDSSTNTPAYTGDLPYASVQDVPRPGTALPFTTRQGLARPCAQQGWKGTSHHPHLWADRPGNVKASSAGSQNAEQSMQESVPGAPDRSSKSADAFNEAISIGLIAADQASFRGESFVCTCYNNSKKVRGTGCAWRSDGVLLCQHLSADGTPILWCGSSTPYGVNDEVEIRAAPPPLCGDVILLLNGRRVAGFPDGVLARSPIWRLAVRVQRSRVSLLSEQSEAFASRPVNTGSLTARPSTCPDRMQSDFRKPIRPRLQNSVDFGLMANATGVRPSTCPDRMPSDFPQGIRLFLEDPPDLDSLAKQEAEDGERLRSLVEAHYQERIGAQRHRGSQPDEQIRSGPEEHFPRTYIPGVGIKLAAASPDKVTDMKRSLDARVAANRARRLAAQESSKMKG